MTVGRSTSPTHVTGAAAEQAAAHWLQQQGLVIIEQNFHCRFGEIDLIALQDDLLVFVEVRHRKYRSQVGAAESITLAKQRKIVRTAEFFLQQHAQYQQCDMRFDVITSTVARDQRIQLEWIRAAFYGA